MRSDQPASLTLPSNEALCIQLTLPSNEALRIQLTLPSSEALRIQLTLQSNEALRTQLTLPSSEALRIHLSQTLARIPNFIQRRGVVDWGEHFLHQRLRLKLFQNEGELDMHDDEVGMIFQFISTPRLFTTFQHIKDDRTPILHF